MLPECATASKVLPSPGVVILKFDWREEKVNGAEEVYRFEAGCHTSATFIRSWRKHKETSTNLHCECFEQFTIWSLIALKTSPNTLIVDYVWTPLPKTKKCLRHSNPSKIQSRFSPATKRRLVLLNLLFYVFVGTLPFRAPWPPSLT